MILNWLRDEKNQRLLAWIAPLVAAGWTLFVYLTPSSPPANLPAPVESTPLPPNVLEKSGSTQNVATGSVQGDAEIDIQQKIANTGPANPSTHTQTGRTGQNAQVGEIKDRAKVTIRQEQ